MKQSRPISNSQLSAFRKSPAHWLAYIQEEKKPPTAPMILGGLSHCLALEKEEFPKKYFILDLDKKPNPDSNFRNAKNRDWKIEQEQIAGDKEVVTSDLVNLSSKMIEALYKNDEAVKYLQDGKEFESKLKWKCRGLEFKGIRDIVGDDFIADLKFVNDADPRTFHRSIFNYGLYRQGGMYIDGEMKGSFTGDPHKQFVFIAVENSEPFGVSVNILDPEVIIYGVTEYRHMAEDLKMSLDNDYFPSYDHRSVHGHFEVYMPNYFGLD